MRGNCLATVVGRTALLALRAITARLEAAKNPVTIDLGEFHAADLGELRAVADILGHSPEMLLRVYAHALPASVRAVAERIGQRGATLSTPSGHLID